MARFDVWCPDDGEGPEDARHVEAFNAEYAAEMWAERDDAESAEYRIAGQKSEPLVIVQAADGTRTRWRVSGEAVPSYSAWEEAGDGE